MSVEQSAGEVRIVAYTDCSPISITVRYNQWNGEEAEFRMNPKHLHDLRYCIDRVLAQPPTGRIEGGK